MSQKTKSKSISGGTGEAFCCCEYENWKGERSHVIACCCDCEAVDEAFDKLFKCERIPAMTIDRMLNTISDRIRIPMCFGKGAVKLRPDAVIPAVLVPMCLCIASLHPYATVMAFLFIMPITMAMFLSLFRRHNKQRRTIFFYSWALTSIITSYLVFQVFVVAFREVLLWEILLVATMTATLLRLLFRVRRDSGQLDIANLKAKPGHKRTHSNAIPKLRDGAVYDQVSGTELGTDHRFYNTSTTSVSSPGQQTADGGQQQEEEEDGSTVHWVDSRSPQEMARGEAYCEECRIHKPPRAGHCPRCQVCVAGRDHHCVWIDSCVGASNHRYFVAAMLLFVVTGFYGAHLTMTTICTPVMLGDWFLVPNDCRWLYIDFLTSMSFVTAMYTCVVCSLMCVALTLQLILISQNVTGQEFVKASRQGLTRCFFLVPRNPYNRGFFRNWMEFLFVESRGLSPAEHPL